jgi:hypothetical protein
VDLREVPSCCPRPFRRDGTLSSLSRECRHEDVAVLPALSHRLGHHLRYRESGLLEQAVAVEAAVQGVAPIPGRVGGELQYVLPSVTAEFVGLV